MPYIIKFSAEDKSWGAEHVPDIETKLKKLRATGHIHFIYATPGLGRTEIYTDTISGDVYVATDSNLTRLSDLVFPADNGKFLISTAPDPFPGFDIEYIYNDEPPEDTPEGDEYIRPRVVFEKPDPKTSPDDHGLRAYGWNTQEDYDWRHDFIKEDAKHGE